MLNFKVHSLSAVQLDVIRVNVLGMLNLADLTEQRKIHLTTYATGCIFHYDDDFPEGSGKGFTEDDKANFFGSYYSKTKVGCMSKLCESITSKISNSSFSVSKWQNGSIIGIIMLHFTGVFVFACFNRLPCPFHSIVR